MRIKRLEIQGFKSFKDKTVIHFDEGITGIVGPNGCGKSNIVDAFFWVMGSQSYKNMRGANSGDLIFNGSSKYQPLGLAEATLIMETAAQDDRSIPAGASSKKLPTRLNTKEISVTRRVFRTGEGEYLMNGVPCRLKDIHELFMDTGVGSKGYSVIEQGQIGKVVNAKPEERRQLIEEAAGIAKYKARKKETLRKIESTQTNLSRLNDIVQEIERNLQSLEKQAHKAKKYKEYKEELFAKEITWGRRRYKIFKQKLNKLKTERDTIEQEIASLKSEIQISENSIETEKTEQLTTTRKAEELQTRIQDLSQRLSSEKNSLDLSHQRQKDLEEQKERLSEEKAALAKAIDSENAYLSESRTSIELIETEIQQSSEKMTSQEQVVATSRTKAIDARTLLDERKSKLISEVNASSDLKASHASLTSKLDNLDLRIAQLQNEAAANAEKLDLSRVELSDVDELEEKCRNELETTTAELSQNELKLVDFENSLTLKRQKRDETVERKADQTSKLNSLVELSQAFEGFGEGPKSLLKWAEKNGKKSNLYSITESIEVDKGFERALQGWLEGRIEYLVATSVTEANNALDEIRNNPTGRVAIQVATPDFHPSTSWLAVPETIINKLKESGIGYLGSASDFVRVHDESEDRKTIAKKFIEQHLGKLLIVDQLNPLHDLIESGFNFQGWSLVSQTGDVYEGSGIFRSGKTAESDSANILKRKRAIGELQSIVADLVLESDKLDSEIMSTEESIRETKNIVSALQNKKQNASVSLTRAEQNIHRLSQNITELEKSILRSHQEITEKETEQFDVAQRKSTIENDILELSKKRDELESEIGNFETKLNAAQDNLDREDENLRELRIHRAQLDERHLSMKREYDSLSNRVAERETRLKDVRSLLDRIDSEKERHTGSDQDIEKRIAELTKKISDESVVLNDLKHRIESLSTSRDSFLEAIKRLHNEGDQRSAQSTRIALEAERLSGEIEHLILDLEEKYGPDCLESTESGPIQEELDETVTQEMTAEEEAVLADDVQKLKERIRRLGDVNVHAIEEYEDLQKRYHYLETEKSDLEKSIENLEAAIEHINQTSLDRFKQAFDAISSRFVRLFPIVFGGGSARMELVYPEGSNDPLEAGVEIMAQPPGKKVSNINLLSGGEKALTAVALIFSIFMVKPSPFCILDEVDAPLDDANIGKFNALLKEMSSTSQFILITHNKKTMELNDTLYGVTMEEAGVSKMVSIQMH